VAGGGGRLGSALWQNLYLVALNADTGAVLWEVPVSPAQGTVVTYMMYAPNSDQLILSTSGTKYNLYTFDASDGTAGWSTSYAWYSNNHGGHMQRPVVIDDKVFMVPRLLNLADGTIINSSIGNSRSGCPTYSASSDALVYRGSGGTICMQDLNTGARDAWAKLRPSCWLNFTPTGGMLLVPEGAGGCSCNGWINTSVGFSTKE
jgi:outer membrane protein assembly factor BamB